MSTQTQQMNEKKADTPGVVEAAQDTVEKGISYLQKTVFGTGATPSSTDSSSAPTSVPADPRLQNAPAASIEDALRDQSRSKPPKELLEEANVAKREQERGETEGETPTIG